MKHRCSLLILSISLLLLTSLTWAEEVTIDEILKNAKTLEGQTVTIVGGVAQAFERGGRTMFMLTQDKKAISVMAPPGVSVSQGQKVRVTGVWRDELRTNGESFRRGIDATSVQTE